MAELGVIMPVDSAMIGSPALSSHPVEQFGDMATKLDHQLNLRDNSVVEQRGEQDNAERSSRLEDEDLNVKENEEEEGEEDDFEFSFVCAETSSPISADDLFDNGQIRPIFPLFGNDAVPEPLKVGEDEVRLLKVPVKKVFVGRSDVPSTSSYSEAEDIDRVAEGPYCAWSKRTASSGESTSTGPEACRKSNSTGFSKLWRFRDLLHRSQSDGKDTFVFLTTEKKVKEETTSSSPPSTNKKEKEKEKSTSEKKSISRNCKKGVESKTTPSKAKTKTSTSSYAMQYGKGREKRRSYLPYRQDLVGFFTNSNAMSRNIHPY